MGSAERSAKQVQRGSKINECLNTCDTDRMANDPFAPCATHTICDHDTDSSREPLPQLLSECRRRTVRVFGQ
ncbi:uncharacterized protein METZ01_LOCUS275304 [marine metagenome]|uniref:Uncharacterized protein n=1 Tax=marine metagenome TaxID=408172 RepID=A0A382KD88_9ZZZZ